MSKSFGECRIDTEFGAKSVPSLVLLLFVWVGGMIFPFIILSSKYMVEIPVKFSDHPFFSLYQSCHKLQIFQFSG